MATILMVGCGDLGTDLALKLIAAGHQCIGFRRQTHQLPASIQPLSGDLGQAELLPRLTAPLDYLVITLTPGEFSEAAYQRTYVEGLQNLLQWLARDKITPKRIFYASSTSVYHQHEGEWVDENSATEPSSFSGQALLAAEKVLADSPIPSTRVRFSGIYGPGRERLIQWAQEGASGPTNPEHFSNRIHRDDCVGVLAHLIKLDLAGEPLEGCYIASDSRPSSMAEVLDWLRLQLGIELSEAEKTPKRIRTGSKRCDSRRLQASGYSFLYPDFRTGYRAILEARKPSD